MAHIKKDSNSNFAFKKSEKGIYGSVSCESHASIITINSKLISILNLCEKFNET